MRIVKTERSRLGEVDFDHLSFGTVFSDHMLSMVFQEGRWNLPEIVPYGKIELEPSCTTLHYAQAVFEGMKAFYAKDGSINIFRPDKHHERWNRSCVRLCIPEIDLATFIAGAHELVSLDRNWVPRKRGMSLYIRPFVFGTDPHIGMAVARDYLFMIITSPVAAYYSSGFNPVRLTTSSDYVRAVKGGLGATKTPANYAASLYPTEEAHRQGFAQIIWLDALEHKYVEEVGTMNIFFLIEDELITAPLEGNILAGVTRDSVLQLAREWGLKVAERYASIDEVLAAAQDGRLKEAFGTGTAAVIAPVGVIRHRGTTVSVGNGEMGTLSRELYDEITGVQYGERPDKRGWCHRID